MPSITASLWEEWGEGQMPQVDMGERAPQGYWGQDKEQAVGEEAGCREGSLGHPVT